MWFAHTLALRSVSIQAWNTGPRNRALVQQSKVLAVGAEREQALNVGHRLVQWFGNELPRPLESMYDRADERRVDIEHRREVEQLLRLLHKPIAQRRVSLAIRRVLTGAEMHVRA